MSRATTVAAVTAALSTGWACAGSAAAPGAAPLPAPAPAAADRTAARSAEPRPPLLPPQAAMLMGLLPRRSVGVEEFLGANPAADGRGVLIAILDSGMDPELPGLARTTTGARKLLDLRDFSDEGRVPLAPVQPAGDTVVVDGQRLTGFGRVRGIALPPYYGGVLRERVLGALPAADLNGDGDDADTMAFVVARASDGWVLFTDTDGDASLMTETPVHDYAVAAERFAYGPVTLVANFSTRDDRPALDLYFDTSGHGSHVAGIAAGHQLFSVAGFDGAAPGAQVLGLKIANDARGGVSVTGSMVRALDYATRYAATRNLPLVVNLSFGVGNEDEAGVAVIDSLLDDFALAHPEVLLVISAGNDGPGLSTVGFPGSAEFALSACALFPGVFAAPPQPGSRPPEDVLGWWSARGGERAKPDLCVPGVAFSNVPRWNTGEEVSGGTSMAAPLLAGLAALLQSAVIGAGGPPASAVELRSALQATATPLPGATVLEQGTGVPNVGAAWRWLRAGHRAGRFRLRALPDGANRGLTAAYRPEGLGSSGDTLQRFSIESLSGQPFARLLLRPDAPWLTAPEAVEFGGAPATVGVSYDATQLLGPGVYVGTVWARPETDTLAGAAFGLTNTVVVPQPLDQPYQLRKYLRAGRAEHLFVSVPRGAGGLHVRFSVSDPEQHASLHVFEPGGRPLRGGSALEVGGEFDREAQVLVRGEDVIPGPYELVVTAPPTAGVTFRLEAALPSLTVGVDEGGIVVRNGGGRPMSAQVAAAVVGAVRQDDLRAVGTTARRVPIRVPPWADELELDIRLPLTLWTRVTDFALSVWDSTGRLVAQHPLNYALARERVPVDTLRGAALEVELLPAFAVPEDTAVWEAAVRLSFLTRKPLASDVVRSPTLGPDASAPVPIPALPAVPVPDGFTLLVEATATPERGVPASRRTPVPQATPAAGATQ